MSFTLHPMRVATGFDEEGMMVCRIESEATTMIG
jgi:hypothetical protein